VDDAFEGVGEIGEGDAAGAGELEAIEHRSAEGEQRHGPAPVADDLQAKVRQEREKLRALGVGKRPHRCGGRLRPPEESEDALHRILSPCIAFIFTRLL
jgi:hypothetical protein